MRTLAGTTAHNTTPRGVWVRVPTGGESPRTFGPVAGGRPGGIPGPTVFRPQAPRRRRSVSPDGSEGSGLVDRRVMPAVALASPRTNTGARTREPVRQRREADATSRRSWLPPARTRTSPNPWVGCVIVATDGSTYEGATEPPGGPHAESRRAARCRRRRDGFDARLHARAVLAPRPHPALRRRDHRRGCRAGRRRRRGSRPARQRRGSASAARRGHRRRGGRVRGRSAIAARALPQAPADRPALRRAEARRRHSTAARPRPTARASGSPASPPGATRTACAPRAMP